MPTMKNTTEHAKHFPGRGPKSRELLFPAGGTLEVTDEELATLKDDRIAGQWVSSGELAEVGEEPAPAPEGGEGETPAQ